MKSLKLLLLLPLFFACTNNQQSTISDIGEPGLDTTQNVYSVTAEDRSMNLAISTAKRTLHEFDKALKSSNPSFTEFAVKKRFITADDGGEHMWIAGLRPVDGGYKGFVNNDAVKTTEVKYGDSVFVRNDEITDWMYLDKNVLNGGYTIREVRNQLNTEERRKMDEELDFKIEE